MSETEITIYVICILTILGLWEDAKNERKKRVRLEKVRDELEEKIKDIKKENERNKAFWVELNYIDQIYSEDNLLLEEKNTTFESGTFWNENENRAASKY